MCNYLTETKCTGKEISTPGAPSGPNILGSVDASIFPRMPSQDSWGGKTVPHTVRG